MKLGKIVDRGVCLQVTFEQFSWYGSLQDFFCFLYDSFVSKANNPVHSVYKLPIQFQVALRGAEDKSIQAVQITSWIV